MQIKTNQTTKKTSSTDLVRLWLEMTVPLIAGFIFLPYLFLFLGLLYTEEFHSIPTQMFFGMIGVQGILVIVTPIITAWLILKRVSRQLQTLAKVISKSAEKNVESSFTNDHWVTLEKQCDDIGLTARQVKEALLRRNKNNVSASAIQKSEYDSNENADTAYSSLFSLNVQETNTQVL